MYRHKIWTKKFNRRTFFLKSVFSLATISLASRLSYLQLLQHYRYSLLSDRNRIKFFFVESLRGEILDCDGIKLATNIPYYQIIYEPEKLSDTDKIKAKLKALFIKSELDNVSFKYKGKKYLVKNNANWEDIKKIEFYTLELPGVYIALKYKRYYPYGESCSHLIGYMGLSNLPSSLYLKTGKSGIEQIFEENLRGTPGINQKEVNSRGTIIRNLKASSAIAGNTIEVALNAKIQSFIYNLMALKGKGAVVVLDIKTGGIKAAVNYPSYDNNIFSEALRIQEWSTLTEDLALPLINRSLALKVSPGSIFKLITALTALEENSIDCNAKINCTGEIQLGDRFFRCWRKHGHGRISLKEAITQSCNVYFYELSKLLHVEQLTRISKMLGLGTAFNLGFKEESKGLIPDAEWRKYNVKKWHLGDNANLVIGQGYILTTPLQLAVMAARIASGKKVIPSLIDQTLDFPSLPINRSDLNFIREGMVSVINSPWGTAYPFRSLQQQIAGKTGTIQLNTKPKIAKLHHAAFIGYSISTNMAISVVLEHGGAGSKAAMIGCQILDYIKSLTGIEKL